MSAVRALSLPLAALLLVPAAPAQHARQTPEVLALQKTKDAIVTIKVTFHGTSGNTKPVYGTGVVIDPRGYVVTNAHVVGANAQATVVLWDGTELTGTVHAADKPNDLALVKLPAGRTYPTLPLAASGDVLLAERIVAVGTPFGYAKTVTTGIVSGLDRAISLDGFTLNGLFQIDAPINPGNSGGPVLNVNGELIALVVAVREGAQGIAFAIPSDQVNKMVAKHLGAPARAETKPEPTTQAVARQAETPVKVARTTTPSFDAERALWSAGPVRQVALGPTGR
jgi:serine protease Do